MNGSGYSQVFETLTLICRNSYPRNATLLDMPYKPYALKDVSGSTGRGTPGAQSNQGQDPPQG